MEKSRPVADYRIFHATVVVDFDGTIAKPKYHNDPNPAVMPGAHKALATLRKVGFRILVSSARSWSGWKTKLYQDEMVAWLRKHRVPFDGVVTEKVPALAYVDDRAVAFNNNWSEIVTRLRMRKKMLDYQEARREGRTGKA